MFFTEKPGGCRCFLPTFLCKTYNHMIPFNPYFPIADVYPMLVSSPSELFSAKVIASKKQAHRQLPSIPALLVFLSCCFPLFLAGQAESKDQRGERTQGGKASAVHLGSFSGHPRPRGDVLIFQGGASRERHAWPAARLQAGGVG